MGSTATPTFPPGKLHLRRLSNKSRPSPLGPSCARQCWSSRRTPEDPLAAKRGFQLHRFRLLGGAFFFVLVFFFFSGSFVLSGQRLSYKFHLHQAANSCWHLKIKWRNKTSLKCIFKLMHNLRGRKEKAVNGSVKYFSVCSCMTFSWGLKDVRVWFVILYVIFIYLYISTLTWGYNHSAKWIFLTFVINNAIINREEREKKQNTSAQLSHTNGPVQKQSVYDFILYFHKLKRLCICVQLFWVTSHFNNNNCFKYL